MINSNVNTDFTNTNFAKNINNFKSLTMEKQAELNQLHGTIKNIDGFKVELTLTSEFELEDCYGNTIYIAKYNKKESVFDLINSNDFQLCSSLDEFKVIIKKYFKRK